MARFVGYTELNMGTNKPYETLLYSIVAYTVEKITEINGWTEDDAMEMLKTRTTGMDNFTSLYHKANADQKLRDRYEYLMSVKLDENSRLRAAEDRGRSEGRDTQAKETAKNLYDMGLNIDQIVQAVRYPSEVIKQWLGLASSKK